MDVDPGAYETDKNDVYLSNYEREFGDRFDEEIALLELGVQRGGSMRLWLDLLPNAAIAGLDLNEVSVPDETGRLHLYRGFQQDPAILDKIGDEVGPFDVIIDDASHLAQYTAASFWHLFPRHLKPGGVYVIDDWSCGYRSRWADGHDYVGSRAALGDFGPERPPAAQQPGRLEMLRRRTRASARPLAQRLPDKARKRLKRTYLRVDGAMGGRRHKSHDYGMVGFVKQLVDATSVRAIDAGKDAPFDNQIESTHVYASQVFVHKSSK